MPAQKLISVSALELGRLCYGVFSNVVGLVGACPFFRVSAWNESQTPRDFTRPAFEYDRWCLSFFSGIGLERKPKLPGTSPGASLLRPLILVLWYCPRS
jgi:hypothetical protein